MSIKIAVLKETVADERRVALDPSVVSRLKKMGAETLLEASAGSPAYFPDSDYSDASIIATAAEALKEADILLRVQPPSEAEISQLQSGSLVISHVYAHQNQSLVKAMQANNITCMAMELIPRITRAQAMDSLSSQATVAGYKAVLMAASLTPRFFPMLTTAAGTIRPSKVVVIGAGVAGLQAIATARRLGAQVEAYDIRPAAREQVESLGAKMIDTGVNAEGEGGYARELTDDEKQQQADVLAKHLAKVDAVISTAAIPGRPAPKIISKAMVDGMKPGAVIVDLAAETGGNCELTEAGKTIHYEEKILHGPLNIASEAAFHASEMYAKNLFNLLSLMIEEGELKIDFDDDVIKGCLLTHDGNITHPATAKLIEGEA